MPPDVGTADTSSIMVKPMSRMNALRIGHVDEIEIGPPLLKPAPKLVKQPARMEMIEKEIAKLENPDQERWRSWRYPSLARCSSSALSPCGSMASCASGIWETLSGAKPVVRRLDPRGIRSKGVRPNFGLNSDH